MRITKRAQQMLDYRAAGLTTLQLCILELIRPKPLYIAELAEALDVHPTTVRQAVRRLEGRGLILQEYKPAATGSNGAPYSALIRKAS